MEPLRCSRGPGRRSWDALVVLADHDGHGAHEQRSKDGHHETEGGACRSRPYLSTRACVLCRLVSLTALELVSDCGAQPVCSCLELVPTAERAAGSLTHRSAHRPFGPSGWPPLGLPPPPTPVLAAGCGRASRALVTSTWGQAPRPQAHSYTSCLQSVPPGSGCSASRLLRWQNLCFACSAGQAMSRCQLSSCPPADALGSTGRPESTQSSTADGAVTHWPQHTLRALQTGWLAPDDCSGSENPHCRRAGVHRHLRGG